MVNGWSQYSSNLNDSLILFFDEAGETLEQFAQQSCGCSIIGRVHNQDGWGFQLPVLVDDVPDRDRVVGLDDLSKVPSNSNCSLSL